MTDLPLDQVRTLLAVVDEGTFDAAAAALLALRKRECQGMGEIRTGASGVKGDGRRPPPNFSWPTRL